MTLERLVEQLVATLEARDPAGVHRPISVAELRQRTLPYRLYRTALGLSNSEDYELLVLRLVAEEDGWVRTLPEEAAARARREVAEPNPDVDLAESLGDATIQIGAPTLARLQTRRDETAAVTSAPAPTAPVAVEPPAEQGPVGEPEPEPPEVPPPPVPPAPVKPIPIFDALDALDAQEEPAAALLPAAPSVPGTCGLCGEQLPEGRPVVFCPHCGRQVARLQCVRCGTELEAGWRHCVMCGHRVPVTEGGLA